MYAFDLFRLLMMMNTQLVVFFRCIIILVQYIHNICVPYTSLLTISDHCLLHIFFGYCLNGVLLEVPFGVSFCVHFVVPCGVLFGVPYVVLCGVLFFCAL